MTRSILILEDPRIPLGPKFQNNRTHAALYIFVSKRMNLCRYPQHWKDKPGFPQDPN